MKSMFCVWRDNSSEVVHERTRPLCGRQFPLAKIITSTVGRSPFPLAIYGEGVADRPGERSHGPGGEVQIEKKITSEKKLLDTPTDYAYKPPSPTG